MILCDILWLEHPHKEVALMKVHIIVAEKRAPERYQRFLRNVLRNYGCETKECFVYITQDKVIGIYLNGIINRPTALLIHREVLRRISGT